MNRQLFALAIAQCCYWFATLVGISLSAIVGMELSTQRELATLPIALSSLGGLASTYALSQFMQRTSRRKGLRLGTAFGVVAAILCLAALQIQSFWLFCFASLLMGFYQASAAYYRLAALDVASDAHKSAAISWVLCASLLAAIAGPTLAAFANAWPLGATYTGPYLLVAVFTLAGYLVLGTLDSTSVAETKFSNQGQSLAGISSHYWVGTINTGFAQLLMLLMMVIAPLVMYAHNYPVAMGLSVIGWHIIGMFLPSFFSGKLIDRWGESNVIFCGYAIYAASAFIALQGETPAYFFTSLFLLGCGWNLVYIGGTTQYNKAISTHNKGKAQGIAEFAIALAGTIAVFSGGVMVSLLSWNEINQIVVAMLLVAVVINLKVTRVQRNKAIT